VSRDVTGPGSDAESIAVSGPDLSRELTGPAVCPGG
jgi:hypothetical protein